MVFKKCIIGKMNLLIYGMQLADNQWSISLPFTGKEKDSESGYYYFGARYFMPTLSIWNSVDPMADKYPSLSPYNYCAWNPLKLVDPNGDTIWIAGASGAKYQYKNERLYTEDGSEYTGNDSYALSVRDDLNTLSGNGMKNEIDYLVGSATSHIINKASDNSWVANNEANISNGMGSGSKIYYNNNKVSENGWIRPPAVGLAHELKHAYDGARGVYDKTLIYLTKRVYAISPKNYSGFLKHTLYFNEGRNTVDLYYQQYSHGFERSEFDAIYLANRINAALGGTKPRTTIGTEENVYRLKKFY